MLLSSYCYICDSLFRDNYCPKVITRWRFRKLIGVGSFGIIYNLSFSVANFLILCSLFPLFAVAIWVFRVRLRQGNRSLPSHAPQDTRLVPAVLAWRPRQAQITLPEVLQEPSSCPRPMHSWWWIMHSPASRSEVSKVLLRTQVRVPTPAVSFIQDYRSDTLVPVYACIIRSCSTIYRCIFVQYFDYSPILYYYIFYTGSLSTTFLYAFMF